MRAARSSRWASYGHVDKIVVCAVAPDVVAKAAFFDETAGLIRANSAGVAPVDGKPDSAEVAQSKGVVDEELYGLATIAFAPVFLVANGDAKSSRAAGVVEMEKSTEADAVVVGIDDKAGTVAPTFPGLGVEIG